VSGERSFAARWVFPVSGPPVPNSVLVVRDDLIVGVEPRGARTPDEDLGNVALVPGFVNAHTHLDLSGARGLIPPTAPHHFTDWLRGVIAYRRTRTPEQTQADIRTGLAECLKFGTTLIGDITAEGASWDALVAAEVRSVVFHEMIGLSEERARASWQAAHAWRTTRPASTTCVPAYSPHAPYSARGSFFASGTRNDIFCSHLAESPHEQELLERRTGPFVEFLTTLGVWEPTAFTWFSRLLIRSRLVGNYLFVHANYLPLEHCRYIAGLHSVVYCPRTHAAFGHAPHPFREFLARNVRVCLGTDSLASNPDLDILAEARFVRERYPDFPGDALLRMITLSGAEALGWADECGSLCAGKSADAVAVPLPNADAADPHELLFAPHAGARRTLFRGAWRTLS
jgi:cytosine/adenosine deaminase-related metal-dependent hydrolase